MVTQKATPHHAKRPASKRLLVELENSHAARGCGLDAKIAQHAFVEVLLNDARSPIFVLGEDVDGADLHQLLGERRVGGDLGV